MPQITVEIINEVRKRKSCFGTSSTCRTCGLWYDCYRAFIYIFSIQHFSEYYKLKTYPKNKEIVTQENKVNNDNELTRIRKIDLDLV